MSISAKTLTDLGWPQLLDHVSRRAHTARGTKAIKDLPFYDTPEQAEERIAEIGEARALTALEAPLPFGGIQDVSTAIARAAKGGVLDGSELLAVADSARGIARLRKHLFHHTETAPRLSTRAGLFTDARELYERITDCFDEHGHLADHASPALGPLRRKFAQQKQALERRMRTFVEDGNVARHLQDRYYTLREDRYVVPVRVDARSSVRGIVHGTSQTGQTVFIEPDEIVELGNRSKLAEYEVRDEEQRILAELSALVSAAAAPLQIALSAAEELDVISACADVATFLSAEPPIIDPGRRMCLYRARHPLMVMSGRRCVPNDIVVEPRSILIISGPNAGGKTVALKTAGLLALMVRAGMHIPAELESTMPWFLHIDSDIGDSQSLENDLSTFSAHLLTLRRYLEESSGNTLLLVDEISVGTEPEQGAALAQSVLEALAEAEVAAIVTTHYERLKALGARDKRFANASVGFDLENMLPTFELHLGVPGSSGALAVARRIGLPGTVVDRAEELIGERRASIEELLAEIADERRRLAEERNRLSALRQAAEVATRDAEAARNAAKEHERRLKQGAHSEAVAALRRAREELDRVQSAVKRRSKDITVRDVTTKLSELSSAIAEHAPKTPPPVGEVATEKTIQPGMEVFVTSLGSRGQVVGSPHRGKVQVQIGQMRTAVPLAEIVLERRSSGALAASPEVSTQRSRPSAPPRSPKPAPTESQAAIAPEPIAVRTADITLDVRGERADEAVDSLERFIDKSLLAARDVVFVIHGHGTGALRSAIRDHLSGHHAVTGWRPGERSEGGDGVTVAFLDRG